MKALKWDFKKKKYFECEIDDRCVTFSCDMHIKVPCAYCNNMFEFGNMYTSRTIHTDHGMGYAVCKDCYYKYDWKDRK